MRGRVDESEGLGPLRKFPPETPNLIQLPDYDQALKKTFNINERQVSPVMHDEIVPVVVVEDLRAAIHPSVRRSFAANRNLGLAGQQGCFYVRCAPLGPTVFTQLTDPQNASRLIVDQIDVMCLANNDVAIAVDQVRPPDNIAGEGPSLVKQPHPNVLGGGGFTTAARTGFTAQHTFSKVFGGAPNGSELIRCSAGVTETIPGPFELPPDWACFVINVFVGVSTIYVRFHCTEYPA